MERRLGTLSDIGRPFHRAVTTLDALALLETPSGQPASHGAEQGTAVSGLTFVRELDAYTSHLVVWWYDDD